VEAIIKGSCKRTLEVIYDRHEEEWEKCINDEERRKIAATWMKEGTLDRWRHHRMLSPIKPFISGDKTWLTVGDGRYGTDAHFIISEGGIAHASDISDKLLKIGSDAGFIGSFSAENAERLSFADNSFDYVLIKEAFHHFPRPWIALYEAFRVCRKAVILIEPNDDDSHLKASAVGALKIIATSAKRLAKRLAGRNHSQSSSYWFEPVGNFGYTVNPKELEKFILGMHYRHIATTGINDAYEEGVEFISLVSPSEKERQVIKRVQTAIKKADQRCKAGLSSYGLLLAALFKDEPTNQTKNLLAQSGWQIKELPKNPYL